MSKSSIEAIKQVQAELTKALEKQKEESGNLQQKLDLSNKEIESLKESFKAQLTKKDEEMKRILAENKKMKEYTDTLMRTRADVLKVAAMEKMMNDLVNQLSKMHEKCAKLQAESDKKEAEAQKIHEVVQKLEKESKQYAALVKYLSLKQKIDTKDNDPNRSISRISQNDLMNSSFARFPKGLNNSRLDASFCDKTLPMPLQPKIVKPIKGGAPAQKPLQISSGHVFTKKPSIQLDLTKAAKNTENLKGSFVETMKYPATARGDQKDKAFSKNLTKFNMLIETQKSVESEESDSDDSEDEGTRTERRPNKEISEKLFG